MRTPSAIVLAALLPGLTSCMSWGAEFQAAYIQTELSGNLGAESSAGGGVSG